ncbi:ACT domain-containing protein ACR8 [Spatholobus suberectus]|nr:ACT domain-containing protein ACR8 [Spatholobus suberectus]
MQCGCGQDMEYVVFHTTINTNGDRAYLEFYIINKDCTPISPELERQRGVRLKLCIKDRQGLLAEVIRTFQENGFNVMRDEISTIGNMTTNVFYVTDAIGNPPDPKIIKFTRQKNRLSILEVKELP